MISLVGLKNWPSAKLLREKLEEMPPPAGELVVSWGMAMPGVFGGKPRLNGLRQLQAFSQGGITCPQWTTRPEEVLEWMRTTGPSWPNSTGAETAALPRVWGRKVDHTKGKDIRVPGQQGFWQRDFWVKVIPDVEQEWRVQCFEGRVIGQGRKVYHGEETRPYPDRRIRSRDNGWRMTHKDRAPATVQEVASAALAAVGYDFGAVDCFVTAAGVVGVFEVNSAPGMDDYTASRYAAAMWEKANAMGGGGE